MAEKAKRSARPKNDVLVTWRMESFPVSVPQNKMYTDKLMGIMEKRVRRNPFIYSAYKQGRVVWIGGSQQGMTPQFKSMTMRQARMGSFDRFSVFTLAKRRHANDVEALVSHIAGKEMAAPRNFTRAKDLGNVVRRDVRQWTDSESRRINRTLRPIQRRYDRSLRTLDRREKRLRSSYSKRIEKARDAARQKKLRAERDRKLSALSVQRRRLQPMRNSISQWESRLRTFQNLKV